MGGGEWYGKNNEGTRNERGKTMGGENERRWKKMGGRKERRGDTVERDRGG